LENLELLKKNIIVRLRISLGPKRHADPAKVRPPLTNAPVAGARSAFSSPPPRIPRAKTAGSKSRNIGVISHLCLSNHATGSSDRPGTVLGVRKKMPWVVLGRSDEANRAHASGLQEGQQLRNPVELGPGDAAKGRTGLTALTMVTDERILP